MRTLAVPDENPEALVAEHVALPENRPSGRAFVRLNMITSVDGASAVAGLSGGLANQDDHAVFGALRAGADAVMVGMTTASAEHYHAPTSPGLDVYVISGSGDISGDPELFASGQATLVLADDAGPVAADVPQLRAGMGRQVDLPQVVKRLAGKVVVLEGGPTLAGIALASGLVDEFFLTISPRVVGGGSARIAHGPEADTAPWLLSHGFCDDEGFLFLRYTRPERT